MDKKEEVMAEKSFFEIFSKYQPDAADAAWLGRARNITLRADKEKRIIEMRAAFDEPIRKATLYRVEAEIAKVYQLSLVRILPQYPAAYFGEGYIAEVLEEAQRIGVVARGFFHSYRATLDADTLKIELPYLDESLLLMELGKTHEVIAGIIRSEFGLTYRVEICHADDLAAAYSYGGGSEALAALDAQLRKSSAEYDRARTERPSGGSESSAAEPAALQGERVMSLLGEVEAPVVENGLCRIGAYVFDVSEPVVAVGTAFEIRPKAIAHITHPERGIVVVGEVFGYTEDTTRDGTKYNISFGLTDGNSSIMVKKFGMNAEDKAALCAAVKDGAAVALRGYAKHDTHKEVVDVDVTFYYTDVMAIKRQGRADNAPQKRVELHLHTTMSAMDALIPPDVAVKQANKWGHAAVALTDHGNVQAYQEAMLVAEKLGQKVIYGMEAYFVNDTASALYGTYKGTFEDEFVVFDIETTGLSNRSCGITEIGAVKVKNGEVLERYGTFVNPEMPIPAEVSELTGITDDMVKDARVIAEVLPEFLAFIVQMPLVLRPARWAA